MTILSDPELFGQINDKIKNDKVNAEAALKSVTDMFIQMFEAIWKIMLICKNVLVIFVTLLSVLWVTCWGVSIPNPALINEEVVIVAHDLTPSDTAQLDRNFVKDSSLILVDVLHSSVILCPYFRNSCSCRFW